MFEVQQHVQMMTGASGLPLALAEASIARVERAALALETALVAVDDPEAIPQGRASLRQARAYARRLRDACARADGVHDPRIVYTPAGGAASTAN
jgi:hypothetical protein